MSSSTYPATNSLFLYLQSGEHEYSNYEIFIQKVPSAAYPESPGRKPVGASSSSAQPAQLFYIAKTLGFALSKICKYDPTCTRVYLNERRFRGMQGLYQMDKEFVGHGLVIDAQQQQIIVKADPTDKRISYSTDMNTFMYTVSTQSDLKKRVQKSEDCFEEFQRFRMKKLTENYELIMRHHKSIVSRRDSSFKDLEEASDSMRDFNRRACKYLCKLLFAEERIAAYSLEARLLFQRSYEVLGLTQRRRIVQGYHTAVPVPRDFEVVLILLSGDVFTIHIPQCDMSKMSFSYDQQFSARYSFESQSVSDLDRLSLIAGQLIKKHPRNDKIAQQNEEYLQYLRSKSDSYSRELLAHLRSSSYVDVWKCLPLRRERRVFQRTWAAKRFEALEEQSAYSGECMDDQLINMLLASVADVEKDECSQRSVQDVLRRNERKLSMHRMMVERAHKIEQQEAAAGASAA